MTDWFVYMVEQERRREEIARAAASRHARYLIEQDKAARGAQLPRYEIMLAALGDRLVDWGCRLQTRYRRLAERTNTMSADALLAQQKADSPGCA